MTLEYYRDQIDRLLRGESSEKFMLNGSEEHAAIIIERMFATAKKDMKIMTRRLDPAIYAGEEVLAQMESFASDPSTSTKIIVEDIPVESLSVHGMYGYHKALPNVEIRRLRADIADQLKFNFSVMDSEKYRFEADKTAVNATVRVDDPRFANEAAEYFDALWEISTAA